MRRQRSQANAAHASLLVFLALVPCQVNAATVDWSFEMLEDNFAAPTLKTNGTNSSHSIIRDMWYHAGTYYQFAEAGEPLPSAFLSAAMKAAVYPTTNLKLTFQNFLAISFHDAVLMLDHPYNAYPEDLTFSMEILISTINTLTNTSLPDDMRSKAITKVLIPNLMKGELPQWFQDLMGVAFNMSTVPVERAPGVSPSVMFVNDLQMINNTFWLHFNEILLPTQRYGSVKHSFGFASPETAARFRNAAWQWAAAQPGAPEEVEPSRYITFLTYEHSSMSGEERGGVANEEEVMHMLQQVATATGLEAIFVRLSNTTSTDKQIRVMQQTRILITRFSPALANTIFLPPGSTVVELVPYNWIVQDLNTLYSNITSTLENITYRSWRADQARFVQYAEDLLDSKVSHARFANFTPLECASSMTCVQVHQKAHIIVDTDAVRQLVVDDINGVRREEWSSKDATAEA